MISQEREIPVERDREVDIRTGKIFNSKNSKNSNLLKLTCDDLGVQEIVFSVTDTSGNTASTTANITVTDDFNTCGEIDPSPEPGGGDSSPDIDTDGDEIVTLAEFQEATFDRMDRDGDGVLNAEELEPPRRGGFGRQRGRGGPGRQNGGQSLPTI